MKGTGKPRAAGSLPAGRYRKTGRIGKGKIEGKTAEKGDKKKTDAAEKNRQHRHDRGPSAQLPAARWPAWRPWWRSSTTARASPACTSTAADVKAVPLQPALIGTYFGSDLQERRPVKVDNVSEDLVEAVIAAEDDSFFEALGRLRQRHHPRSLGRPAGRRDPPGRQHATQQLVKNIYLSHQRTLSRKGQELILALMLESRYSKRQILEAYFNEIYLGGSGGVSLMGMGAASRAYFGKDPAQLDLAESGHAGGDDPLAGGLFAAEPSGQGQERRDWVLSRIAKLGRVPKERIDQALAEPMSIAPEAGGPPPRTPTSPTPWPRGATPLRHRESDRLGQGLVDPLLRHAAELGDAAQHPVPALFGLVRMAQRRIGRRRADHPRQRGRLGEVELRGSLPK